MPSLSAGWAVMPSGHAMGEGDGVGVGAGVGDAVGAEVGDMIGTGDGGGCCEGVTAPAQPASNKLSPNAASRRFMATVGALFITS